MCSRALLLAAAVVAAWLMACGPTPAEVNNSGHELYQLGDYSAALDAYQGAQKRSPESAEPYYNYGNVLYRMEEYEESQGIYDESLRFAEHELRASGFFNRGNASFQKEQYADAIEAYKEVLRMDADNWDAKHNLELALKHLPQQGQEEEKEDQQQEDRQEEEQQEQEDEQRGDQEQDQPLTREQARQILESVGERAQTLQQRRGQVLVSPNPPSGFDW